MDLQQERSVLSYERTRAVRFRAMSIAVICAIGVAMLAFVAKAVEGILFVHLWSSYAAGASLDPTEIAVNEFLYSIHPYYMPWLPAGACVVLMGWMYQMLKRIRRIPNMRLRVSPWTAVFGWLQPWTAFVTPFWILKGIYTGSRGLKNNAFTPLIGCWWAMLLAGNFLVLAGWFSLASVSAEEDRGVAYGVWQIVGAVPFLVSCICLTFIVLRVERAMGLRNPPV